MSLLGPLARVFACAVAAPSRWTMMGAATRVLSGAADGLYFLDDDIS